MNGVSAVRGALLDGRVVLLPTDTVYGLMAALDVPAGVAALYALKDRPRDQPCQVLFYGSAALTEALAALPDPVAAVARALLPGPVTLIVADRVGRYAAAAGAEVGSVGLRAPVVTGLLSTLDLPLVATSANHPGGPDADSVSAVPSDLREQCGAVIDGGVLTPTPSAVVDLRGLERGDPARLIRAGSDPGALAELVRACGAPTDWR